MDQIKPANLDENSLNDIARIMRGDIVDMICKAGSGHPGGSLSCIDILTALYFGGVLKHDPSNPELADRDRFILAKGHAAPALYAVLARSGYFDVEELSTLRQLGSRLQGHPDSKLLAGVEVSTGSLGQGLSIAAGLALGLRLEGNPAHVFTVLGDGECEEGQVWEACMFAAHQKLGNLIAIVDRNGLQIDGPTGKVCDPACIGKKFEAFGWEVCHVDGHDIPAIVKTLNGLKSANPDVPHAVMAKTVKGKGVSFMEGQCGWHGKAPSADEAEKALEELGCVRGGC